MPGSPRTVSRLPSAMNTSAEYSEIRQNQTFLHNIENQNRYNIIRNILVFETLTTVEIENTKEYIFKIWKKRQNKIEEAR